MYSTKFQSSPHQHVSLATVIGDMIVKTDGNECINVAREQFDVDIYPCWCCSAPVPGSVSTSPCKYPAYY